MTSSIDNRSFMFRVGIMASQALLAMQPQKPLTGRQTTALAEWEDLLPKLIAFERDGARFAAELKTADVAQIIFIREAITANAWRFPAPSADYFEKLLLTLGCRLRGESRPVGEMDEAKNFLQAMSGSMLCALHDSEPDDED